MTAFTLGDVARICKVPPARLKYWERTQLLESTPGGDSEPAFGFEDLVSVRRLVDLLERGVPLRRIRHILEAARERMPDLPRPLGAMRVWSDGERVVLRHNGVLLEPDGQMVIDFSEPVRADESVAELEAPGGRSRALLARQTALDWFERGCKLDTDRPTYADAIEAYARAIELDPDFADAHCNLGSLYFNQGRRAAARACFEQALALEAAHVEANLNLASLLEEEGHNQSALRHYRSALAADPLCADTHVSLALLYEKLGLPSRAREHWGRYVSLDPQGSWADVARGRLGGS